jgi:hypothetical protein
MSLNDLLQQRMGSDDAINLEKTAQYEHFIKVAQGANVPLEQMTTDQIEALYNSYMGKTAEEESKEESDDEKKKRLVEKAKEEHESKTAGVKLAMEYQELGRHLAHGFHQELLEKSAGVGDKLRSAADAVAGGAVNIGNKMKGTRGGQLLTGSKRDAHFAEGERLRIYAGGFRPDGEGAANKSRYLASLEDKAGKEEARKVIGARATAGAAGAAAVGGGAAGIHHAMKKDDGEKEASAYDLTAAHVALELIKSAGWNGDQAADRLNAVLTLGTEETEFAKTAALDSFEAGIEARALEFAAAAGYPIQPGEG